MLEVRVGGRQNGKTSELEKKIAELEARGVKVTRVSRKEQPRDARR